MHIQQPKPLVDSVDPSGFSSLSVLFPLNTNSVKELSALSPQCKHLTVTVSQPTSVLAARDAIPLPPLPRLTHLHLIAPDHDPFHGLLSFRLALQHADVPLLTHLTIDNLSFDGILALRWGGFTSFGDASWTGGNVWQGLKELDVKVMGWWGDELQEKEQYSDEDAHLWDAESQKARKCKEDWRTGTRVLHDWLHSFAANTQLHTFKFEWVDSSEGPNPFLLDQVYAKDRNKAWFSAPGIHWTGLRELWLGNVVVSLTDVRRMKDRMPALEMLVVPPECLAVGLGGVRVDADDGRNWVGLLVEGTRVGKWEELDLGPSSAATARGSRCVEKVSEDRASMVLPFVLDLSPGDGEES